jgi:hypothetical protein
MIADDNIVSTNGFFKPYNLSKLAEGPYVFEISDSEETIKTSVDLKDSNIEAKILPTNVSRGFKLVVPQTFDQTMLVNIYLNNRLIASDKILERDGFMKKYDLSRTPAGKLEVKVFNNDNLIIAQSL